jgi:hypothetical protein
MEAALGMRRAVAVIAVVLTVAPAARAESGAQVRALAARAHGDPAALAELRRVRAVDGRPVDFGRLLGGPAVQARLRTLASGSGPVAASGESAAEARSILHERRFRGSSVPRPFHGILAWLGDRLAFVGRAWDWLARQIPGGGYVLWAIVGGLVVAAAAWGGAALVRRREGKLVAGADRRLSAAAGDPAGLEREADRAERDGDFELALRLRFRAGLIRLGRARALPLRESLTSGEASSILHLTEFDALARRFDEVVYGRRPAAARDLDEARDSWPRVLDSAGKR